MESNLTTLCLANVFGSLETWKNRFVFHNILENNTM